MTNDEKRKLITQLQSQGLKLTQNNAGTVSRKGGAGPSDHQAVTIDGTTVMIPVYNSISAKSNYTLAEFHPPSVSKKTHVLEEAGKDIASIKFPQQPKFYSLKTAEGIPYNHIALLHSHNVLATTVLQTCIRYSNRNTACQFCAIEQSLAAGKTIAQKNPPTVSRSRRSSS